jgi:hypothetical protein
MTHGWGWVPCQRSPRVRRPLARRVVVQSHLPLPRQVVPTFRFFLLHLFFLKNLKAIFGWRNEMIEGVFYSSSFSCARNYWCTARSPARETDASSQRAGCHATSTACAPCPESRATRPPPPRTSHTSGPSVPVRAPVPTKRPQGETAHPTPAALAAAPPRDPPAPGGGVSVSTQRAARASHSLTIAPEDSEADCKT